MRTLTAVFVLFAGGGAWIPAAEPASQDPADAQLLAEWEERSDDQRDAQVRRNLEGWVRAAHLYLDEHGALPPAAVVNPQIAPEKRLCGFVLLLPYVSKARPMSAARSTELLFDEATCELASQLAKQIDLQKAWDDPHNLPAARTLMPTLLIPGGGPLRNARGLAVSHLAFVRGYDEDSGAFTDDTHVAIQGGPRPITDGTSETLALAQIADELGPWTAAGRFTSRQLAPRSAVAAKFGAPRGQLVYAVNCDSWAYLLDLRSPDGVLTSLGTMDRRDLLDRDAWLRYATRAEAPAE